MARGLSLCLVVVLALASSSVALKCYFCQDCENGAVISGECPNGAVTCVKAVQDGKVTKACATKGACDVADLSKQTVNRVQTLLGDLGAEMPDMELPEMHCCETDYCNAASSKMMNPALLLLLPLALYFLCC